MVVFVKKFSYYKKIKTKKTEENNSFTKFKIGNSRMLNLRSIVKATRTQNIIVSIIKNI